MRKSLLLFCVLLSLAVGGTIGINGMLLQEKDDVQITETVVHGEKSVVDGITITQNTKYGDYIHWNTTYIIGEESVCKTDYQFSEWEDLEDIGAYKKDGIEFYTEQMKNFEEETDVSKLKGLDKAMRELSDETKAGEYKTKTISLKDYADYYTFDITIELPEHLNYFFLNADEIRKSLAWNENAEREKELNTELLIAEKFEEFFKIPVIEDHLYNIAVQKDEEGNLYGWGKGSVNSGGSSNGVHIDSPEHGDAFSFHITSVYSDSMCYFTFDTHTWNGNIVDTGQIQGGYGIYGLPFDAQEGTIDIEGLKMLYPLEASTNLLSLQFDAQKENLLLFTEDEKGCRMTVIDSNTMQQKQELYYTEEKCEMLNCLIYEDFIVLRYRWDEAMLLTIDENGNYQIEFSFQFSEISEPLEMTAGRTSFDWDGKTLFMSDFIQDSRRGYYMPMCGFYVVAFDKEGLRYYGIYESSLDTGKNQDDYYFHCMPTNSNAIEIEKKTS